VGHSDVGRLVPGAGACRGAGAVRK
jgi:hypothetical protein